MGLVGTMAALVLGLLVASAKGFYEAQRAELTQMSANIALLDRIFALYGPETKEPREICCAASLPAFSISCGLKTVPQRRRRLPAAKLSTTK